MHKEDEHIEVWIEGCKKNDRKAQEQLYRAYYKVMVNLCLRYTKNETDAVSVLNTGFLKVFKNINRYNPQLANLYTWIRTIIINTCLDYLKLAQKDKMIEELDNATEVQIEPDIILKMKAADILSMVKKLSPMLQAVFNLYVMENYDHKEIASLLKISESTSRWHLSEARKKLQQQIEYQKNN